MNTDRVKRYAELTSLKRQAKATLNTIQEELTTLETELLDALAAEGIDQVRVDTDEGRFTIFPRRTIWGGIEEGKKMEAIEVLEKLGLKDLLSPNYQSLSSWIREHEETGIPLPEEFNGVIMVREVFSLAVRKANGK